MSLSSLLLPNKAPLDSELDSLFKLPVVKAPIPGPSKNTIKKRELPIEKEAPNEVPSKRTKFANEYLSPKATKTTTPKKSSVKSKKAEPKAEKKSKEKGKAKEVDSDDDEIDKLEEEYLNGKSAAPAKSADAGGSENDDEGDSGELVHELLWKKNRKWRTPKTKHIPKEETLEQRDQRTIFIGNLPIELASKKPLQKQLKHHIVSFLPMAKIESIRFRSIPFQAPTAKLATSDDGGDKPNKKMSAEGMKKTPRLHEKERASVWRSKLDENDNEDASNDEKRFLNSAQKKKIAFINQEFHSSAGTVNAYLVFAHPPDSEGRPTNLPPLPPSMDPYQAALSAAEKCDGTIFMERMLRVDLVAKNKTSVPTNDSEERTTKFSMMETDPRLSVFIGNLDFASKEEDLRAFFESVMAAEKGQPPAVRNNSEVEAEGTASESKKPSTWVTRVRIVRDKDTQLGKGFAYVQFVDRECVDELLALEEQKLKFAKRKLRVQRCKTAPGTKELVSQRKEQTPAVVVLKGDPRLGEKLSGLPKEERKQIKSNDADRVARRLAKKRARMAMPPKGGKSVGKVIGGKTRGTKDRDRKRVRK
ncbi:hypothetical protein BDN70DRAFT_873836 [Pholiota conissans]|uniref:Nucleolar protein 12 n=1 Tax=Pholiota conissans TaxID=109636 RepID=A0A9P5Z8D9_9AGAR|nr:hypothetical protein BDN70DRAFT_873836 [Pholiota conissans]